MVAMDYESFFRGRLGELRKEGRYRVFPDLERRCGAFPRAYDHRLGGEVTVWCSDDYLGMGQHPAVVDAMLEAVLRFGTAITDVVETPLLQRCASAAQVI
jgi:5-aminolevulinate synthase